MFRLLSPDLRADGDQPFIFGRAARVPTPTGPCSPSDSKSSIPARCYHTQSRQQGALSVCNVIFSKSLIFYKK